MTSSELIGGTEKRDLVIVGYDPNWPSLFDVERGRIVTALGNVALTVEHIGSTSVPGLAAKPIIDVLVTVPDVTAEEEYIDPLLAVGYEHRVREPGHRMVGTTARDVHVHLHGPGHPDVEAFLLLRGRLCGDHADRELYAQTKVALISQDWPNMNAYAEAKTDVIEGILSRARGASPSAG